VYGDRSYQVARLFGTTVHSNPEAAAIILATGSLADSFVEAVLIISAFSLGTGLHLACHWLVAIAFGKGIDRMVLTRAGRIDYAGPPPGFFEEIARTAAGATMNGICAVVAYGVLAASDVQLWDPLARLALRTFAECSLILTAINFLPAVPLDGGLILRRILERFLGKDRAWRAAVVTSFVLMSAMAVAGVVLLVPVLVYLGIAINYDNWRQYRITYAAAPAAAR
jgi:Zn-dependent protease